MVKSRLSGFSLVEIVLAVGIVSIALLSIFALFSNSLKSNAETLSQHEAMGLSRSFRDFLQSGNTNAGFTNVFNWVKNPSSAPEIYAFATADGSFTNGLSTDSGFLAAADDREGRLFRIVADVSPNMPINAATGTPVLRPTATDLPGNAAAYTNDAMLALQVRVYSVSAPGLPLTRLQPVLTYDTAISR